MKALLSLHIAFDRWAKAVSILSQYGRDHRRVFVLGTVMGVLVIGLRLALPWLFAAFLKPWMAAEPLSVLEQPQSMLFFVAVLLVGLSFMGFFDHRERLYFGRFAIQTVNQMRRAALATAAARQSGREASGDLLARLIGDSARIKNGVQIFLVHVATNGALCCGMILLMLFTNATFAAVFLTGLLAMVTATIGGATRIYVASVRHRAAEGRMANSIQQDDFDTAMSRYSGEKEAAVTRIQGRTTWLVHTMFGLTLFATVLVGMHEKGANRLTGRQAVIITIYAWMLRAPVVQLARQGARTGKIVACIERFADLLEQPHPATIATVRQKDCIRLEGIRIKSDRETGRRRRLAISALELKFGESVAILGKPGAGKTTLLTLLAQQMSEKDAFAAQQVAAFVPHEAHWWRQPLREYFGLDGVNEALAGKAFRASRARYVIERLPGGLAAVVGSYDLSCEERQSLALARGLLSPASVLLLDDPIRGLSDERAVRMLVRILALNPHRTLIMALSRPLGLDSFDRVIRLKKGRVSFDGPPQKWEERVKARQILRGEQSDAAAPKQAVILAAGCGRRCGNALPKALLPVGGRTLLEHQIELLRRYGVEQICVVVGYGAEQVRRVGGPNCHYVENGSPEKTDSLYSLWLASEWVSGPFVLLNADVLAHPEIYRRVIEAEGTALAYDSTSGQDGEHMKVRLHGKCLDRIGKDIPQGEVQGESVGILKFSSSAFNLFFEEVDRLIAGKGESLPAPAALDQLARRFAVRCIDIAGLPWTEIDFPEDLRAAQEKVWPLIA